MKKLFAIAVIFTLVLAGCEDETETETETKLKINNQSFTEITDVIWQNVSFSNNQYENAIKTGTNVIKTVDAGAGYIYFKRKSNPITARTSEMIVIEEDNTKEFIFIDNTLIVEANNPTNTGTLGALQSTVVWWDDAEGELQPYSLSQSYVEYYSGSASNTYSLTDTAGSGYYYYHLPKNGNKSIRIGGTNTALLQLRITLTKKARLSFWYANYFYSTAGTTFSINGVEKMKWTTDVNWSLFSIELEPGENNLIWAKKDGVIGTRYYFLSLDDILIYYTE